MEPAAAKKIQSFAVEDNSFLSDNGNFLVLTLMKIHKSSPVTSLTILKTQKRKKLQHYLTSKKSARNKKVKNNLSNHKKNH